MMSMLSALRPPGGLPLAPSFQPYGFTPDATTAYTTPGVYYRPLNLENGQPAPLFTAGIRTDGAIIGNGQPFFDGNLSWNTPVGNDRITGMINDINYTIIGLDQLYRYNNGLYPVPPNFNFPPTTAPLPGTPANPFGGQIPYNPFAPLPGFPNMLGNGQMATMPMMGMQPMPMQPMTGLGVTPPTGQG